MVAMGCAAQFRFLGGLLLLLNDRAAQGHVFV